MPLPEELARVTGVDLSGKRVLVTGSTDGIGRETALALGRLGADVTVHGREWDKGRNVVERLEGSGATGRFYAADFEDPSEVSELAHAVRERPGTLDVLVNNAGALYREPHRVWGDVEATFAVNHLAHFLLTEELRPLLEDTGGRIVNVSSDMHRRATLDLESATSLENYSATRTYALSKLANVMHAYALSRRLEYATANVLHPGAVPGSALYRTMSLPVRLVVGSLGRIPIGPIKTVREGAATSVYLAASPEVEDVTSGYFSDCEETVSSEESYDRERQEALWSMSEEKSPKA